MRVQTQRCFVEVGLILVLVLFIIQLKKVIVIRVNGLDPNAAQDAPALPDLVDADFTPPNEPPPLPAGEKPSVEALQAIQQEEAEDNNSPVQFTPDGVYLQPDWSLIHPQLQKTKRIVVDFEIRLYTDRYNLSDGTFTTEENLRAFQVVSNTWARANIWARFKVSEIRRRIELPEDKADAYKWWILGMKSNKARLKEYFKRDYDKMLVKGPGGLGASGAKTVLTKYFAHGGHDLFNWILGAGGDRVGKIGPPIRLYFVHYFPWYNGMGNLRRIYIRNGSCNTKPPKKLDGIDVSCVGWGKRYWEDGTMSIDEFIRIVAHEIGHTFGLHHPTSKCVVSKTSADAMLMLQQRATTIKGTPCSTRNKFSRFARFLPLPTCTKARNGAKALERVQTVYRQQNPNH